MWYDSREAIYAQIVDRAGQYQPRPLPEEQKAKLIRGISGVVVLPEHAGYDAARHTPNPIFDHYPSAIVCCQTDSDVALCLQVARETGFAAVARSGGHSTGGFSTQNDSLVIDVSGINDVCIASDKQSVTVGAGCNFRKLYGRLEDAGLHLTGGACGDVCIGGFMQGGGYGFSARLFGLNCDQVLSADLMLTDGKIVTAAPEGDHADLFKAIRGGTGSNFGIVLRVTYVVQPDPVFAGFSIHWQLGNDEERKAAAASLDWLQREFIHTDHDMSFQLIWLHNGPWEGERTPQLVMRGIHRPRVGAPPPYAPVLEQPGAELQYTLPAALFSTQNRRLLTEPYPVPQLETPTSPVPPELKRSRIIRMPLGPEGWKTLLDHYVRAPNPFTIMAAEIYGGAIPEARGGDTVFIHRDADFDLFCDVFWREHEDPAVHRAWLEKMVSLIEPYWDGGIYQNYPDPEDGAFAGHFWGEHFDFLGQVKQRYDPDHVLRYPQGIGVTR